MNRYDVIAAGGMGIPVSFGVYDVVAKDYVKFFVASGVSDAETEAAEAAADAYVALLDSIAVFESSMDRVK